MAIKKLLEFTEFEKFLHNGVQDLEIKCKYPEVFASELELKRPAPYKLVKNMKKHDGLAWSDKWYNKINERK